MAPPSASTVPEPSSLMLLTSLLAGVVGMALAIEEPERLEEKLMARVLTALLSGALLVPWLAHADLITFNFHGDCHPGLD